MKIVKIRGTIENGAMAIKVPQNLSDGEVDVIIVAKNEPDEFEELRQIAREKGYNSKEKILELIGQIKQQMATEKRDK